MTIVLNVIIVYIFIFIGLRIVGKREFSEFSPLDLISLLLIPEIVSQGIQGDNRSLTAALLGVATLMALVFLVSVIMQYSKKAANLLEGTPTLLVARGSLLEENLQRERVLPDEVLSEIRKAGLESITQAAWVVLESDGKMAVIPLRIAESAEKEPL